MVFGVLKRKMPCMLTGRNLVGEEAVMPVKRPVEHFGRTERKTPAAKVKWNSQEIKHIDG